MSIFDEAAPPTQQEEALGEAIENLSAPGARSFTFTQYTRYQFAQDGYVFWVRGTNTISVVSALHIATERDQEIDNTIAVNSIIFDAQSEVTEFNAVNPSTMWVTTLTTPGGTVVPVAFQRRGPFFVNAGVYHYAGFAVFPPFGPLLVASAADLPTGPIVSNSLPIWLTQNTIAPVYPSFLVPENIQPPYVAAHVEPELTHPLQPVPFYYWPGGSGSALVDLPSYQLYQDSVQLIMYGFTNAMAQQLYAGLIQTSLNDDTFGFCGQPARLSDEKRTQPEIAAIAMKKILSFDASYYQTTADAIARRLILSAAVTFDLTVDAPISGDSPISVS